MRDALARSRLASVQSSDTGYVNPVLAAECRDYRLTIAHFGTVSECIFDQKCAVADLLDRYEPERLGQGSVEACHLRGRKRPISLLWRLLGRTTKAPTEGASRLLGRDKSDNPTLRAYWIGAGVQQVLFCRILQASLSPLR